MYRILLVAMAWLLQRASAAGGYAKGHKTCTEIKLYPVLQLTLTLQHVAYEDFETKIYATEKNVDDLFHVIEHALDYAYNKTYHDSKSISANLAHCETQLLPVDDEEQTQDSYYYSNSDRYSYASATSSSNTDANSFTLFYDMEAYDSEYKYKMEKLFKKKYFKEAAIHEFEHYFHEYHVNVTSSNHHVYIKEVHVIDTSITFEDRLRTVGIMIAVICGIFTVASIVIAVYSRTQVHQKHLREIADEFGFDDVSEVSQLTHFKLC